MELVLNKEVEMDSGNSDSLQSSNGGDNEEYNSHGGGDTISSLVNQSTTRVRSLTYNPALHQPMFDDPIISNYRNMQNNMIVNNNLDMAWSKTLRPDPNCTESTSPLSYQLFTIQNSNMPSSSTIQETMNSRISAQLLLNPKEIMNTTTSRTSLLPLSDNHQKHVFPSVSSQNTKKRSRASRRAPTTVLTTDTNNFRAMVQEFTGIPAPPFTSSSSTFPRNYTKLDNIFGTLSSMRTNPLDHLSTPFSAKVQPIVSQTTSSMFAASMADSVGTNADDSYHGLQSENLFTMQNPILASLLQSNPPNHALSDNNPSIFESLTRHGSMQIQSSNRILDEFGGLGQGLVEKNGSLGALPGLVSADPARWGGGAGGANGGGGDQVRSIGNKKDFIANGKRLKGMIDEHGAVVPTNEGMMESWIRSSTE